MKRFYCDHCGTEMHYSEPALSNTNDKTSVVLIAGTLEVTLYLKVQAKTIKPRPDNRPSWERTSINAIPLEPIRDHADLCGPCRWGLIEQLRAGHNIRDDTTFPPLEKPLDWDDTATPEAKRRRDALDID